MMTSARVREIIELLGTYRGELKALRLELLDGTKDSKGGDAGFDLPVAMAALEDASRTLRTHLRLNAGLGEGPPDPRETAS